MRDDFWWRRSDLLYLIGGAPRVGKSILGQQVAATLRMGWISTDLLMELLRTANSDGVKTVWDASPKAIGSNAEWFFPYLERFIWGASSVAENYLIEGVDFLPEQAAKLSSQYQIQAVFLGISQIKLESFDRFQGRSHGYADLSEELRRQIVHDVPLWSEFIREQAEHFGFPYFDMSNDFAERLAAIQCAQKIRGHQEFHFLGRSAKEMRGLAFRVAPGVVD